MKISKFTDDHSDKVITLEEKCGLAGSWNNPEKDIVQKDSDKNGKFLIGQIGEVLMTSIVIGYDGHRRSAFITLPLILIFRAQAIARF